MPFETARFLAPSYYQPLPGLAVPILFKRGVAFWAQTLAAVMAEAAFQRLQARSEQLAQVILQESTALLGKDLQGDFPFVPLESR